MSAVHDKQLPDVGAPDRERCSEPATLRVSQPEVVSEKQSAGEKREHVVDVAMSAVNEARKLARIEFRRSLQRTLEELAEEVPIFGRLLAFERALDMRVARALQRRDERAAAALLLEAADRGDQLEQARLPGNAPAASNSGLAFPSVAQYPRRRCTFRLFVYNTFEGQEPATGDGAEEPTPSWVLRIHGHVLNGPQVAELAFTSVFERVVIAVDPDNHFQQAETIEWRQSLVPGSQVLAGSRLESAFPNADAPSAGPEAAQAACNQGQPRPGQRTEAQHPAAAAAAAAAATAADDSIADGIELRRCGQQPVPVTILLYLRRYPPVYQLSPELVALLGVEQDTLAGVLTTFWHYIRRQGLMHPERPGFVLLNEELRRIFGWSKHEPTSAHESHQEKERSPNLPRPERTEEPIDDAFEDSVPMMPLHVIGERLREHLGPAPPLELHYTIQFDSPVEHDCYDIEIEWPDALPMDVCTEGTGAEIASSGHVSEKNATAKPLSAPGSAGLVGSERPSEDTDKSGDQRAPLHFGRCSLYAGSIEIQKLQQQFEETLERIHAAYLRRDFYRSFAKAPAAFLRDLIVSQARDARLVRGQSGRTIEEERRSGLYYQQWLHEAIPRYLWRTLRSREHQHRQVQYAASEATKAASPSASPTT